MSRFVRVSPVAVSVSFWIIPISPQAIESTSVIFLPRTSYMCPNFSAEPVVRFLSDMVLSRFPVMTLKKDCLPKESETVLNTKTAGSFPSLSIATFSPSTFFSNFFAV